MVNKDFSVTTFVEIKTHTKQLISVQCRREDISEIKKISELIYHIEQPQTKELKNICHGGFGRYTRFNIEQKKYAGGGCGYIECIKINNPPENRNGNIIHECNSNHSNFYEFDTIENAIKSWEKSWGNRNDDNIINSEGFIRKVICGWYSPWFYAVSNQALYGDFSFPNRVGIDHPIYRPFNKFKVSKDVWDNKTEEYIKQYGIKTCIGYNETKENSYDSYKSYKMYHIYWDDGTSWDKSSLENAPELLEKDKYKIVLKTKIDDFQTKLIHKC